VFVASLSAPSATESEAIKDELDVGAEADVEDAGIDDLMFVCLSTCLSTCLCVYSI